MTADLTAFMHSFCKELVRRAALLTPPLALNYDGAGARDLLRNLAIEGSGVAAIYSVLRCFGGPPTSNDPLPRASMQMMTIGKGDAALVRAMHLFGLFEGGDAEPMRMTTIAGYQVADNSADGHWRINSIDMLGRPGMIGVDEAGRNSVPFNFIVGFIKLD